MIEVHQQITTFPHLQQTSVQAATVVAAAGISTLLSNVPCAFASRIDVFVRPSVNLASVTLRMRAQGTGIVFDTALGPVGGGTVLAVSFTGAIGEAFDIAVGALGAAGVADVWAIARP